MSEFGTSSIGEMLDLEGVKYPDLDFEEEWEDPLQSEHTDLESVPSSATISFRSGRTTDTQRTFFIKRAMMDPEAEVIPYPESEP